MKGMKMKLIRVSIAAIGGILLTAGMVSPANADYDYKTFVLKALEDSRDLHADPQTALLSNLAELAYSPQDENYVSHGGKMPFVRVPASATKPVEVLVKDGFSISVVLPFANQSKVAKVITSGALAYDNQNGSATAVLSKKDSSLQIATVITTPLAPELYEYRIQIPAGLSLKAGTDGAVNLVNAEGKFFGGIAPAWAKDARGKSVPTHYEISGSTLTQVVEHHGLGYQYPIIADPWFGIDLIERTTWVGGTLQVYPTWWGRTTGVAARWAAWDEVVSKTPGNRENTPSMRDQLYCHFDFVRLRAPNKPSWNLDLTVPAMDYATLVLRQCN
jgi:hypothetical protein